MNRARPVLSIMLLASVVLVGCTARRDDAAREAIGLTVVFSPFLTSAPLFVALDRGFFADEGLDVELAGVSVSTDALTGLIRGEVDVVTGGLSVALLNAIGQGAPIRLVASRGYVGEETCYLTMVASSDAIARGMTIGSAPRGTRVVAQEDNFNGYWFTEAVKRAGRDPSDFEYIVATSPALVALLGSGQVDFAASSEPTTSTVLADGLAAVVLSATDVIPDFDYGYIVFGPTILERNEEAGYRFMRAYRRGVSAYEAGKTPENIASIARYTNMDPERVAAVCWPEFRRDLAMPIDGLLAFQHYAVERGLMDAVVGPELVIDRRFIDGSRE